jgi:hypothetical protein
MNRPDWDDQFRETQGEREARWAETRRRRIANGQCWQCAKPIPDCKCPNVNHNK